MIFSRPWKALVALSCLMLGDVGGDACAQVSQIDGRIGIDQFRENFKRSEENAIQLRRAPGAMPDRDFPGREIYQVPVDVCVRNPKLPQCTLAR